MVVPDQRGYNLSQKPTLVKNYALGELVGDVAAADAKKLVHDLFSNPVHSRETLQRFQLQNADDEHSKNCATYSLPFN